VDTSKLALLLETEKKQLSIDQLETQQRLKYPVLGVIQNSFRMFENFNPEDCVASLALAFGTNTVAQDRSRKIINQIRNIIHWYKSIDLSRELVREPIEMFMANNNIILRDMPASLLVGRLVLSGNNMEKELPDAVFARSFFVHYDDDTVLRLGDFCYGHQVNVLAFERFMDNVLGGETPDPLFLNALADDDLLPFIMEFFNRDRGDYPEIMSFVVGE
jgi:hypothetical protein